MVALATFMLCVTFFLQMPHLNADRLVDITVSVVCNDKMV